MKKSSHRKRRDSYRQKRFKKIFIKRRDSLGSKRFSEKEDIFTDGNK